MIGIGAKNYNIFQPLARKLVKRIVTKFGEEVYFSIVVNGRVFPEPSSPAALPKGVTYSQETFGSLLQQHCSCQ